MLNKPSRFQSLLGACALLALTAIALLFALHMRGSKEAQKALEQGRIGWVDLVDGHTYGKLVGTKPEAENTLTPSLSTASTPTDGVTLNPAPNEALIEAKKEGNVPKVGEDGTKPWIYYSRPSASSGKAAKIALIITGVGLNNTMAEKAVALDPVVCLAFSAYTPELNAWMMSARSLGHEFLIELPLELNHFPAIDPGPLALMSNITPEENAVKLLQVMSRSSGYVGLLAPRDEVFFASQKDFIKPIIDELSMRGVLMIFAHNEQRTILDNLLSESALPYLHADIKIGYGLDKDSFYSSLDSLEAIARERGHAIGVIEFSPKTPEYLNPWIQSVGGRGFQLVPISALAKMKFS